MDLLDLATSLGLTPKKVGTKHGGEYACSCPNCGGSDRFTIWPNEVTRSGRGRYWCRQCKKAGDAIQFCREFMGLSYKEATDKVSKSNPSEVFFPVGNKKPIAYEARKQHIIPELPSNIWINESEKIVKQSSDEIFKHSDILELLKKRGLSEDAVFKYRIGFNDINLNLPIDTWSLTINQVPTGRKSLWLPRGVVIPTILDNKIVRINIRRTEWTATDIYPKYCKVPGSMKGMSFIGQRNAPVMIVVESELDAYALHHAIGDFAFVIATCGASVDPDIVTDDRAKKAQVLLICHDNDDAGSKMFDKWKQLYLNATAVPTPIGKDVGEFIEKGGDLRQWVLSVLPTELTYKIISGDE